MKTILLLLFIIPFNLFSQVKGSKFDTVKVHVMVSTAPDNVKLYIRGKDTVWNVEPWKYKDLLEIRRIDTFFFNSGGYYLRPYPVKYLLLDSVVIGKRWKVYQNNKTYYNAPDYEVKH